MRIHASVRTVALLITIANVCLAKATASFAATSAVKSTTLSEHPTPQGIFDWLCAILRIDPAIASKIEVNRGGARERPVGTHLVVFNLRTSQEELSLDCNSCYSPVLVTSNIVAIVDVKGIVTVN